MTQENPNPTPPERTPDQKAADEALIDARWLVEHDGDIAACLTAMVAARQLASIAFRELEAKLAATVTTGGVTRPPHPQTADTFVQIAAHRAAQPFDELDAIERIVAHTLPFLQAAVTAQAARSKHARKESAAAEIAARYASPLPLPATPAGLLRNRPVILFGDLLDVQGFLRGLLLHVTAASTPPGYPLPGYAALHLADSTSPPTALQTQLQLPLAAWRHAGANKEALGLFLAQHVVPTWRGGLFDLVAVDDIRLLGKPLLNLPGRATDLPSIGAALKHLNGWCKYVGAGLVVGLPCARLTPTQAEFLSEHADLWHIKPAANQETRKYRRLVVVAGAAAGTCVDVPAGSLDGVAGQIIT